MRMSPSHYFSLEVQMSVRMSVCLSVRKSQKPSTSQNHAYQPNLRLFQPTSQLAIMPISHHANQPPWTPTPSQPLRIITMGHHANQPL